MRRVAGEWLSGYAGLILLLALLVNISTFLFSNGYGLILPAMREDLKLSHFQEGTLIFSFAIASLVSSVASGILASRYGSRLVVVPASVFAGIAIIFLGTSSTFLFALVMSAVVGIALGGCSTPVMGLLVAWFDISKRGTAAGLAAAGSGVSFIIIGVLVPWLTDLDPEDGWRHTWYVLGVIQIVVGAICLAFLRESPGRPRGHRNIWPTAVVKSRAIWIIQALAVCSGWCQSLYTTFFGVYMEQEGVNLVVSGRLWGLLGLVSIGSGLIWGGLSDRLGRPKGFLFSYVIYALGLLLFWTAPLMAGFIVSVVLVALVFRANYTLVAAACGDYVPPQLAMAAFGLTGIGIGIGRAIAPPIGGGISDATGDLAWAFILAMGGAIAGALIATSLRQPTATS